MLKILKEIFKKKHTILIVDDDPVVLESLGTVLRKNNYNVTTASDGEEALEIARESIPSLILMDINMPRLNGDVAAMRLGSDEELRDIPIIMLTAFDNPQQKVFTSHIGVVDYVVKPYDVSILLRKIEKHLSKRA